MQALDSITLELPDGTQAGALYHADGYLLPYVFADSDEAYEFLHYCRGREIDLTAMAFANVQALFGFWKGLLPQTVGAA